VSNAASGGAYDPDDFLVGVDGGVPTILALNRSVTLTGLTAGTHTVELSGIAPNCSVSGAARTSVTVGDGATGQVSFEVVCVPPDELARLRFVFSQRPGPNSGASGSWIVAMNADGSGRVALTDGTSWDHHPNVSADGRRILFLRDPIGVYASDIYSMNTDGTDVTKLIAGPVWDVDLSPDGRELLFVGPVGDYGGRIYVSRSDGTGVRPLMSVPSDLDDGPAWSPDGTQIAFTRFTLAGWFWQQGIWVVDRDGTDPVARTFASPWGPAGAVWGPDGSIAFTVSNDAQKPLKIGVMNASGSVRTLVEGVSRMLLVTDWSADGEFILYLKTTSGGSDVFLQRVADGTSFRLTADGKSWDAVFVPGPRP
jgi:Tol biopolymer transport system component